METSPKCPPFKAILLSSTVLIANIISFELPALLCLRTWQKGQLCSPICELWVDCTGRAIKGTVWNGSVMHIIETYRTIGRLRPIFSMPLIISIIFYEGVENLSVKFSIILIIIDHVITEVCAIHFSKNICSYHSHFCWKDIDWSLIEFDKIDGFDRILQNFTSHWLTSTL